MTDETNYRPPGRLLETRTRVVVGLDLSLTSTGIAAYWDARDIRTNRVRSSGKAGDTWGQRSQRLRRITDNILEHVPPESLVIVEGPSYASVGGSAHDRSGLWWMVFTALEGIGCEVVPASPTQRVKYALGKGGGKDSGKDNVLAAAIKTYPDLNITGNDVADAVILMAMGCRLSGVPIDGSLSQARLDALTKLEIGPVKR